MALSLFTVSQFLSREECVALVTASERAGFEDAPITTGRGFVMMPDLRNNTRVIVDDAELAARLWSRLRDHVAVPAEDGWRPVGLNERFRFYRYRQDQAFRWHRDGAFVRNAAERSLLTFMVYLNDGFTGGETEFEHTSVVPVEGLALVFRHGLRHQGAEVTRGTKYVLRSDVMFRSE